MKTLAFTLVAAGALLTVPASAQTPNTDKPIVQAQLNVEVDPGGIRVGPRRHYYRDHYYRDMDEECRTVTIRERRGDTVVIKKIRRCD